MDKLERYLDRVCLSMGGPKALRQHVRQELREHLLDAAAQHRSEGLSEEAALERAMEDFGGPDEIRSDLDATHGHRLLPVVIDKAMQWKERTMRAKWLWETWAYLALAVVILLDLMWICFGNLYLMPKFQKLTHDGVIDAAILNEQGVGWMPTFLVSLQEIGKYTTWLLIAAITACVLFEWRIRSENKSLIRLSAWGTVAIGLTKISILMAACLIIPYQLAAPHTGRVGAAYASQQITKAKGITNALQNALEKKDWNLVKVDAAEISHVLDLLVNSGFALGSLTRERDLGQLEELRTQLSLAMAQLAEIAHAADEKDISRATVELRKFKEVMARF